MLNLLFKVGGSLLCFEQDMCQGTAMAKHNIGRGWGKSGIYPLNNTKVAPPIDNTATAATLSTPVSNCRHVPRIKQIA
jgi:hypothetical protein